MTDGLHSLTIHVPNVWQTCEWYRHVFGIGAILSADASAARISLPGQRLLFSAHEAQQESCGPRRLSSFLLDPPAFHLVFAAADVQSLFGRALAYGAVSVREPLPDEAGCYAATLRDLNGILILLSQLPNESE